MKRIAAFALLLLPSLAQAADTLGKQAVRTQSAGDVTTTLSDGTTPTNLAQVVASNGATAGNGLFVLGAVYNSSLPSLTSGRATALQTDSNGRLIVTQDASAAALATNLAKVNGAALSASNPVIAQLSDGAATYTGAKSSQLPAAIGQTTKAASMSVALASDQGTLAVSQGAPSGAAGTYSGSQTNIASAGTSALVCKGSLATSTPLKLYKVIVAGSAAARCTVRYNDNGSFTNWGSIQTSAQAPNGVFDCIAGFCGLTTSSTSTTQQIEANCTNFDAAAQDFSCSVQYCQAASGC